MKPLSHHHYIIDPNVDQMVTIRLSRSRLRELMRSGQLVASDFHCSNNCAKCVVRELVMECAAIDLASKAPPEQD